MAQTGNKKRNEEIIALRNEGKTYKEIGERFNLAINTVHTICKKAEKETIIQKIAEEDSLLRTPMSKRTINCLIANRIKTVSQLRDFAQSKELTELMGLGTAGKKEIERFLGIDKDDRKVYQVILANNEILTVRAKNAYVSKQAEVTFDDVTITFKSEVNLLEQANKA